MQKSYKTTLAFIFVLLVLPLVVGGIIYGLKVLHDDLESFDKDETKIINGIEYAWCSEDVIKEKIKYNQYQYNRGSTWKIDYPYDYFGDFIGVQTYEVSSIVYDSSWYIYPIKVVDKDLNVIETPYDYNVFMIDDVFEGFEIKKIVLNDFACFEENFLQNNKDIEEIYYAGGFETRQGAFKNCTNLTKIEYFENWDMEAPDYYGKFNLGHGSFENCVRIKNIEAKLLMPGAFLGVNFEKITNDDEQVLELDEDESLKIIINNEYVYNDKVTKWMEEHNNRNLEYYLRNGCLYYHNTKWIAGADEKWLYPLMRKGFANNCLVYVNDAKNVSEYTIKYDEYIHSFSVFDKSTKIINESPLYIYENGMIKYDLELWDSSDFNHFEGYDVILYFDKEVLKWDLANAIIASYAGLDIDADEVNITGKLKFGSYAFCNTKIKEMKLTLEEPETGCDIINDVFVYNNKYQISCLNKINNNYYCSTNILPIISY